PLGEEELRAILEDADIDGPLVNYRQKGHKVEALGLEPVEGTDALKLKVTLKNGDVRFFFLDSDYYVPIKIDSRRMVRGAEREYEATLRDYKKVGGIYVAHSVETRAKRSPEETRITFGKIEANVPVADGRCLMAGARPRGTRAPVEQQTRRTQPRLAEEQRP